MLKLMSRDLVRDHGFPAHMQTEYCKWFKSKHNNCVGCESENGCLRTTSIILVMMEAAKAQPKSAKEAQELTSKIAKTIDKLLNPKTTEAQILRMCR